MTAHTAPVETFDYLVFGGTGDLALRKLLPALYLRDKAGQITAESRVMAISRSQLDLAEYKAKAEEALRRHLHVDEFDEATWERFGARLDYVAADATSTHGWDELQTHLSGRDDVVRVFYLATSPELFGPISERLQAFGLVTEKSRVVLEKPIGRSLESAREINAAIGETRVYAVAANAGRKEDLERLVEETHRLAGPIDIVIGNAGVNPHYGPIGEIPDDAYNKIMQTNVQSNLWLARLVAPDMAAKGSGSMIFTASVGALKPSPTLGTYGMSKLALIGLVRNLALEYGPQGIRANAICPGVVKTEFARALWDSEAGEERARTQVPLRRFGQPEDFAGVAVFLASDASSYMTGQALTLCGGTNMWS